MSRCKETWHAVQAVARARANALKAREQHKRVHWLVWRRSRIALAAAAAHTRDEAARHCAPCERGSAGQRQSTKLRQLWLRRRSAVAGAGCAVAANRGAPPTTSCVPRIRKIPMGSTALSAMESATMMMADAPRSCSRFVVAVMAACAYRTSYELVVVRTADACGATIIATAILPRTSMVVSLPSPTHTVGPIASAFAAPSGTMSFQSVSVLPPTEALLDIVETRVTSIFHHWK